MTTISKSPGRLDNLSFTVNDSQNRNKSTRRSSSSSIAALSNFDLGNSKYWNHPDHTTNNLFGSSSVEKKNKPVYSHIKKVHTIENNDLEFMLRFHPQLGIEAIKILQTKLHVTEDDQKTSLDVYMNHVFKKAQKGKTYTAKNITDITNVYKGFLMSVSYIYKLNLVDFIFKSKLGKRSQELEFTPVVAYYYKIINPEEVRKLSNVPSVFVARWKFLGLKEAYTKIIKYVRDNKNNPNRQTLFYIPLALTSQAGTMGHQNMLLVDTTDAICKVYTIDPTGKGYDLKKNMNAFFKEKNIYSSIQCIGRLYDHVPCQNLMGIQSKTDAQAVMCTVLATFQVYLLSRYEPSKLHNLIQNTTNTSMLSYIFGGRKQKVVDPTSLLYQYEHMNQGQQRYVVGKFIERIFNVAVNKIDTISHGRFTKDIEELVISNIQNDLTKELFRTAFVKKEHIPHLVDRGNITNVHPGKFTNKAHLFSR